MMPRERGLQATGTDQMLDVGVIVRAGEEPTASQMVSTAIAHVRPISSTPVNQADRTRGSRSRRKIEVHTEGGNLGMGTTDGTMQEPERIDPGPAALVKSCLERSDGDFGSTRTIGVTPHTVDGDEQRRVAVPECGNAVLIVTAVADQTACGDINVHDFPCVDLRSDW
jgi:hypothetical protein